MIACGSGLLLIVLSVVIVYLRRRQNRRDIFKHPERKFVELPTNETNGKVEMCQLPGITEEDDEKIQA